MFFHRDINLQLDQKKISELNDTAETITNQKIELQIFEICAVIG